MACTGDREIGVVSGRVGLYAYSAPLKKTVRCTALTSFEGCASSWPCSICYSVVRSHDYDVGEKLVPPYWRSEICHATLRVF